jgi:hypothetical protein
VLFQSYRRTTRHVLTWDAKCIDADGGIFEFVLYYVNCTNFVTWTISTSIRNSTYFLFLINNLELYSEIVLSRKPFGIGHMYNFLLRMTDTMTSLNTDLSSLDTCIYVKLWKFHSLTIFYFCETGEGPPLLDFRRGTLGATLGTLVFSGHWPLSQIDVSENRKSPTNSGGSFPYQISTKPTKRFMWYMKNIH